MPRTDAQLQVTALLRRYLIAEANQPSFDWQSIDDGAHLSGVERILGGLEAGSLPDQGDPLAIAELEWRGIQAKFRAFSRYEAIYIDSPAVLEEMAAVMRRWPSIKFERGNFDDLWPDQYQVWVGLSDLLDRKQAVSLDGVRAKLRYQLEMRDIWDEDEGSGPSTGRGLLQRAIALLDQACPDPMLQLGYQIAETQRDDDGNRATALWQQVADIEARAGGLHATSLEGALVHLLLACAHLGRDADAHPCKQHIVRACRVVEAHSGMIMEELGGARLGGESDPLLPE